MKKKILIVNNTMGRAGAEKSLISLLQTIDYDKVSVSLLSIVGRGEMFLDVPKEVKVLNKKISYEPVLGSSSTMYFVKLVLSRLFGKAHAFRYLPYFCKCFVKQCKAKRIQFDKLFWRLLADTTKKTEEEYDLAIAFLEGASTYYVSDRVKAKSKITVNHVNFEKAGYFKELDYKYYENMDYICCVSNSIKKVLDEDVFPNLSYKTRVFPNIVSKELIRSEAVKPGGFTDGFSGIRILTVARLHPQKGLDTAIEAMADLVNKGYKDVRWYVLGDGQEKNRLEKLISKHGMENNFILLGSNPNPYTFMAQCDIYVQPSRFEGLSLTLQEALILNKPCITTKFDGIPDLLQNKKDAIVIDFSKENITNAIKELADSEKMRKDIARETEKLNLVSPNKVYILYDIMNGKTWEDNEELKKA